MMEDLKQWWIEITSLIAVVTWLVRLEGSSKSALRDIERLERLIESDRKAALEARREQNEMLREVRTDIKRLVAKVIDHRNRP
ncbi:MAG: hypothetical protein Q4G26_07770 [Paracoccus sp. (in: a-proteobacteria)]|nr:hypothetical protein [Paracoccus sp. (in: a-proteobacteria)]